MLGYSEEKKLRSYRRTTDWEKARKNWSSNIFYCKQDTIWSLVKFQQIETEIKPMEKIVRHTGKFYSLFKNT